MAVRRTRAEVAALREAVLDRWAAGDRLAAIAAGLGVTVWTVARELREGHRRRDPRAAFRYLCAGPRGTKAPAGLQATPKARPAIKPQSRREAILDAWAAGMDGPEIGRLLGMRWKTATMIVCRARYRGDPRAARRQHNPADGLPPSTRRALERAARRHGVTVTYPEVTCSQAA